MLVLSRKSQQCINIGPDIKVCVLGMDRRRVRIGITAPRELQVLRSELLEREATNA